MRGMLFAGSAREGHAGTLLLLQLQQQQQQGLAAGKVSGDKSSMKIFTTTPRIDSPNSLLGLGLGRRLAMVNWIKMFYLIASDSKRSI